MNDLTNSFAIVIKTKRISLNMTQQKLAELSSVDESYIRSLESATEEPSLEAAINIAFAFDISPYVMINEVIDNMKSE